LPVVQGNKSGISWKDGPGFRIYFFKRRRVMAGSTYNIIELVGTSDKSWEEAAATAVETAAGSLRDLRVAEVIKLDMTVENGKVKSYRARVNLSFKYHKAD
jgi:flavin-binding protein dodecin